MHPTLELICARRASGSKPGHRDDDARLAVVLEGGSSRAAYGGGMVVALEELGLIDTVDAVYGSSAGALNGAWFVCQRARANIHGWWVPESLQATIHPRNLVRGGPVVDVDTLIDVIYATVTPMGFDEILASAVDFHPTGTDTETGASVDLAPFIQDVATLRLALKATARLPLLSGAPIELGGRRFIDGGVADNVPAAMALDQGATHVLVLRTSAPGRTDFRTPPLKQRAVARWLARHAPGVLPTWHDRDRHGRELEQQLAADPRILQVFPPADAPRISVLGRSEAVQRRAVEIGAEVMRAVLAPVVEYPR